MEGKTKKRLLTALGLIMIFAFVLIVSAESRKLRMVNAITCLGAFTIAMILKCFEEVEK